MKILFGCCRKKRQWLLLFLIFARSWAFAVLCDRCGLYVGGAGTKVCECDKYGTACGGEEEVSSNSSCIQEKIKPGDFGRLIGQMPPWVFPYIEDRLEAGDSEELLCRVMLENLSMNSSDVRKEVASKHSEQCDQVVLPGEPAFGFGISRESDERALELVGDLLPQGGIPLEVQAQENRDAAYFNENPVEMGGELKKHGLHFSSKIDKASANRKFNQIADNVFNKICGDNKRIHFFIFINGGGYITGEFRWAFSPTGENTIGVVVCRAYARVFSFAFSS